MNLLNKFNRLLFRIKVYNLKVNYECIVLELKNEGRTDIMPWKEYLIGKLRCKQL